VGFSPPAGGAVVGLVIFSTVVGGAPTGADVGWVKPPDKQATTNSILTIRKNTFFILGLFIEVMIIS
jgi:hypothetical protein